MLRWSGWGTRLLHICDPVGRNLALNILWGMFGKYLIEQSGAEGKICWLGLGWNFLDNIITTSNTSMDQNNNFILLPPPSNQNCSKCTGMTTKFYCDPVECYNMSTQTCKVWDKKKACKALICNSFKAILSDTHNLVSRGLWWNFLEYQVGNPLSR